MVDCDSCHVPPQLRDRGRVTQPEMESGWEFRTLCTYTLYHADHCQRQAPEMVAEPCATWQTVVDIICTHMY